MRRRERLIRAFLTLLAFVGLVVVPAAAASATAAAFDDTKYTQEQRDEAAGKAADAAAAAACGPLADLPLVGGACPGVVKVLFKVETIADTGLDMICGALPAVVQATCREVVDVELVKTAFTTAYQGALAAYEVVVKGVEVAKFFADPANMLETFTNSVKEDSMNMITSSVSSMVNHTSFDATTEWWRESYAVGGAIGLSVMVIMLMINAWQSATGKISNEDFAASLVKFAPFGVLMIVMGPPVAWGLQRVADGMTAGIANWFAVPLDRFLTDAGVLGRMTGGVGIGALVALVIYGLLFLAGIGLLFTRAVQEGGLYIGGVVIAIAWGMIVNPRWRRKALALPMVWIGVLFSGPLMILLLGWALQMASPGLQDATQSVEDLDVAGYFMNAFLVCVAIGVPAFAPYALLKWAPLLPDGSDSVAAAGAGSTGAAVVGAAGSAASQIAMQRASGNAASGGGGGRGGGTRRGASGAGGGRSGGGGAPRVTSYSSSEGVGGGTGGALRSGAGSSSGGRLNNLFRSKKASTSGAGSPGGLPSKTKSLRGAKAAGGGVKAAGGGVSKAAGAAAGIGTGGAYFVAQIGATVVQAGISRAREAAAAAAPEINERASET